VDSLASETVSGPGDLPIAPSTPRVLVGIVSWNTARLLERCLVALPEALEGLDWTAVVVDNASSDGSAAVAASFDFVRVIRNEENRGYARAMNQALSGAGCDVLIALNPDTEPPPRSLSTLVVRLLDRPSVGLVAPRLVNSNGSLQHSAYTFPSALQAAAVSFIPYRWRRGALGRRFWFEGCAPHDRPADVEWVIGAVHVIRADAVDAAAPYSERWFMYVEDLDLCWDLAARGWGRRLEAEVEIPHVGGASASQAWGPDPAMRFLPASYDWYARRRGVRAMRGWAAINTAGVAVRAAAAYFASWRGNQVASERALALRRLLPLHAKAMVKPPVLETAPPLRSSRPRSDRLDEI
jgi:GT2 family glycosyltransferase